MPAKKATKKKATPSRKGDPNVIDLAEQLIRGRVPSALQRFLVALSPALVAANTTAEQTFNPAGLASVVAGDYVLAVVKPTAQAGLGIVGARVSAAGTVAITFINATAGGLTPTAAETYAIYVARA